MSIDFTPFKVSTIVYEVIENHLLSNNPKDLGYAFDQRYDRVKEKSSIFLDIENNWKADETHKRPAIFIGRQAAKFNSMTLGQRIGSKVASSQNEYHARVSVPVTVTCVASPVGFVEQFADYVHFPLMYYSQAIEKEYCFHKFRLVEIGKPEPYEADGKEGFSVSIALDIEYDKTWAIKGDDLKLRAVSVKIAD